MAIFDKEKFANIKETSKKHTFMIVDDEETQLRSLESILEEDYRVITATGGQEALEIIDNMKQPGEVSVIISDQRMPNLKAPVSNSLKK